MSIDPIDQTTNLFWNHSSTFWTAIQAIAGCTYTILVVPTLWFIYLQVRAATKAFQFDAVRRLQELIDDFRDDRRAMFQGCPLQLAATDKQFPKHPPGAHRWSLMVHKQPRIVGITAKQKEALLSLDQEVRNRAVHVIARLNDIGQLVEDGFISRRVFLGKYHVLIIQCCHMVEVIRRDEEKKRGGNYGHRLLRMRHWATTYNDIWPKHRNVPIEVTSGSEEPNRRVIYRSPRHSFRRRIILALRGCLSWY